MTNLLRLLAAFLLLVSGMAGAVINPVTTTGYFVRDTGQDGTPLRAKTDEDRVKPCQEIVTLLTAHKTTYQGYTYKSVTTVDGAYGYGVCSFTLTDSAGNLGNRSDAFESEQYAKCPANSTLTNGVCVCNSPYTESNGSCVPPPSCPPGPDELVNVTQGYTGEFPGLDSPGLVKEARFDFKPDGSAAPPGYQGENPTTVCRNGCRLTLNASNTAGIDFWISKQPTNNGLYRLSADLRFTPGGTCTATPMDGFVVNGLQADPPCNGSKGWVQGKLSCIPAAKGDQNVLASIKSPSARFGNPTAGSGGGNGTGSTSNIPMTNGTGGNKGGPPDPADGSVVKKDGTVINITNNSSSPGTGTKTAVAGEEQVACGAPGQPKCQMDESGTPKGEGFGKSEKDGLGTDWSKLDTYVQGISNKSDKDTSWSMPTWFTGGGCQAWHLGTFPVIDTEIVVDICHIKPYVDGVMNFIWVVGTFLACLGMVSNVMMGPTRV